MVESQQVKIHASSDFSEHAVQKLSNVIDYELGYIPDKKICSIP